MQCECRVCVCGKFVTCKCPRMVLWCLCERVRTARAFDVYLTSSLAFCLSSSYSNFNLCVCVCVSCTFLPNVCVCVYVSCI